MQRTLNDLMEFDHPVIIHPDGTVTDAPADLYAPNLLDEELDDKDWEFFTYGYTGQYSYIGPIMHNSEFIGGRLERDLLANPGIYVVVAAYWMPDEDDDEDEGTVIEGWAVCRYVGPKYAKEAHNG